MNYGKDFLFQMLDIGLAPIMQTKKKILIINVSIYVLSLLKIAGWRNAILQLSGNWLRICLFHCLKV